MNPIQKKKRKPQVTLPELKSAFLESETCAALLFEEPLAELPPARAFKLIPGRAPRKIRLESPQRIALEGRFDPTLEYRVKLPDGRIFPLLPEEILNRFTSRQPLGLLWEGDKAVVRFFSPRAQSVQLAIFDQPGGQPVSELSMNRAVNDYGSWDGVWEIGTDQLRPGRFYGYRVSCPFADEGIEEVIFADPYAWAVTKRNTWQRESLSVILPEEVYRLGPASHHEVSPRDLVIYEAHIKDFSELSQNVPYSLRGRYEGTIHEADGSPFRHLVDLGVNAVEWLPLQDYDFYELDYDDPSLPAHNTWNIYARNHWGYMPAYYFAPEARYATGSSDKDGDWIGSDGSQVLELRDMIHKFHEAGIAVIVDVVYNHIAQYGQNPIRQIDPQYSLRHDLHGNRESDSGCGNDLKTERPMMRRLILESLQHWVRFYGVDGFRFDLAGLIDGGTLDTITGPLRDEYPGLHLIAEPWGGRYDHHRFSRRNWASWNDLYRNGILGSNPESGKGFIFGCWGPNDSDKTLIRHLSGNLAIDGGPFRRESHSINYLASHDGYTLGDFIRIASGEQDKEYESRDASLRLSPEEVSCIRFGLFILCTSRGGVMLLEGDEWGRPKMVEARQVDDPHKGKLDHNSYEKDDPTNWLDWSQLEHPECSGLKEYTRGLIELRKTYPALRIARRSDMKRLTEPGEFAVGYRLEVANDDLVIFLNAHADQEVTFKLPDGRWKVLADHIQSTGAGGVRIGKMIIPPVAGALLLRSSD